MSLSLHGIGVSKGIAIGKVYIIDHDSVEIPEYRISAEGIEEEVARFQNALATAREQLQRIREQVPKDPSVDIAGFIEAHLMMLDDSFLTRVPIELIQQYQYNAELALKIQGDSIVQIFGSLGEPYLNTRKEDLKQVVNRVQRILRGYLDTPAEVGEEVFYNTIVLADELSPADLIHLRHCGILGFVTEYGGTTSHTAILARSLGIPAIVGLQRARSYIRGNDLLILDVAQNTLIVAPDQECIEHYQKRQREEKRQRVALNKLKLAPIVTPDGTSIILHVNIEFPEDLESVKRVGGTGIGLYRTEFLFLNRQQPPDEEEHLEAYLKVIRALKGGPVTIRTFDLGADKTFDSSKRQESRPLASNPALGLRAIRLCMKEQKLLFKPQLRAILRASAEGQVRLMIPLVSGGQELLQVRKLVTEMSDELRQKSIKFNPAIPFGAMVEVPSMAVCVDLFARYVDFLSIGTNDLIQYTLALDRVDGSVSYLYDPTHPAVLRLIKMSIDAANKVNKPISMCGEMASDSRYVRLLLGLGLRSFSVNPESFLEVKQIINHSNMTNLAKLANQVINTGSPVDIENFLKIINSC